MSTLHSNPAIRPVAMTYSSLEKELYSVTTKQYFNMALLCLILYNIVTTMHSEMRYFWHKPWSRISLVYFANRYVGLLGAVSNIICVFARWTSAVSTWATVVLIDYILVIRVLALYHQNRRLAFGLGFLFVLDAASDLGMLIYGYIYIATEVKSLANDDTVCAHKRSPPQVVGIISWCVPMTYGFILLGLALYKAREYWKLAAGFKGFHLVKVLVVDQVMIYFAVIFCSVLKIMYNRIFDDNRFVSELLNAAGSPALLSVLGGYLLVHLKEAAEMGFNEGTSYRLKSVSALEFL